MEERRNIVQAEFFHVGHNKNATLDELLVECVERAVDGLELAIGRLERGVPMHFAGLREAFQEMLPASTIKTAVRFFDEDGSITAAVQRHNSLENRKEQLIETLLRSRGFGRWWVDFQLRRVYRKIDSAKRSRHRIVAKRLQATAESTRALAVEKADRRFRFVRDEELHELLEAISGSANVWLFVFPPNDLLAEKHSGSICAM